MSVIKRKCKECGSNLEGQVVSCRRCGSSVQPSAENLTGQVLADRYRILTFLGEGGMGVVYKASCLKTGRTLAIKLMHQHLMSDDYSRRRFEQEASAASCLTHPHVIAVHDFGMTDNGQPYMVQDYLDGQSLEDVIQATGRQSAARVVDIFTQVCDALGHAHRRGIIHRDMKPSNIMLLEVTGRQDFVKVVDFGIAKLLPQSGLESQHLTADGETFGSPLYMSPEQCMAQKLDPRSDIYTLGCVLYEALIAKPPIVGESMLDTMQKQVTAPPKSFRMLGVDDPSVLKLEPVVFKALQKNPDDRQQTMQQLKDELIEASGLTLQQSQRDSGALQVVTPVSSQAVSKPGKGARNYHLLVVLTLVMLLAAALYVMIQQARDMIWLNGYYDRMMEKMVHIQQRL